MATRHFFKDDKPHGLVKRFMYKRYLQAYIPKTQKFYTTVILDGFAGKGRYSDAWPEVIEEYGSPVIAVRVAVEYFKTDKRFSPKKEQINPIEQNVKASNIISINLNGIESKIILIFVEKNRNNFNHLVENVQKTLNFYAVEFDLVFADDHIHITVNDPVISIHCKLYHASFDKVKAPVGPSVQRTRYLTFIDPFGYSQTPMRHVKTFVSEHREVYINFMSSYVNRFVAKAPRRVADIYGIDIPASMTDENQVADYVKDLVRGGEKDDLDNCVENYVAALKEKTDAHHVLEFEMRDIKNARLYHLVFVTDHIKGVEAMKESMVCGTQEPNGFSLSDYKILRKGIEMSLKNEQIDMSVANALESRFKNNSSVPIDDIKNYILFDTPFVFRKKTLKILEKDKMVLTVDYNMSKYPRRRWTYPDHIDLFSFHPPKQPAPKLKSGSKAKRVKNLEIKHDTTKQKPTTVKVPSLGRCVEMSRKRKTETLNETAPVSKKKRGGVKKKNHTK